MPESDSHISVSIRDLGKKISIPNKPNITIQIEKSTVHLLEMEDVLFHLNSAVMMPENPEGPSSRNDKPSESQLRVTGIRALGLAFEQLRTEPKQKILIAGHSDRSGEAQYNFELSELRAMNVMYLLKGGKNDWAQVCAGKHKVEDYQQIMQHYSVCLGWDCDPGKIDDDWGPNTETATKRFILQYNS
ncbi:MAG: OmpA family protein, partial [Fibrobacterota bacterium]